MDESPELSASPQRSSPSWIWGLLALACVLLVYVVFRPDEPEDRGANYPGAGVELSTLRLAPLTGEPPPLEKDDIRGKVSVINFWGPWCHFCREEMPHLLAMEQDFRRHEDFRLLLVSNNGPQGDLEELRQSTAEYLRTLDADHPTYYDPHFQSLSALARDARLPRVGFPITAVVDRQGVLRGLWIGFRPSDAAAMERLVEELLQAEGGEPDAASRELAPPRQKRRAEGGGRRAEADFFLALRPSHAAPRPGSPRSVALRLS